MIFEIESVKTVTNYFLDVYIKPYARWTPYFMGLYFGIFYYQYQQSLQNELYIDNRAVRVTQYFKEKFENNQYLRIAFEWSGVLIMVSLALILRTLQTGHKWDQIW